MQLYVSPFPLCNFLLMANEHNDSFKLSGGRRPADTSLQPTCSLSNKKKKEDGKSVVSRRLPQHPGLACLERGKRQLYTTPERANYSFKRAPELGACDRGPARRRKCPGRRTAAARFEVGYAFEHCCGATAPQGSESGRRPGGGLGGQPQQLLLPRRLSSSRCSAGHDDTASGSVSSVCAHHRQVPRRETDA